MMRKSKLMRNRCLSLLENGACSATREKGNGASGRVGIKSSGRRFQVTSKRLGRLAQVPGETTSKFEVIKGLLRRAEARSEMKQRRFGGATGEFTVAQEGEGWIVLEDGRRVGGTLRSPFPTREAAQRYVERELADEAELMAKGDLALSAKTRAIRETDAELWALFVNIEEEFADEDEATREAAHRAAGTFIVMIRLVMAGLEAAGKIYRTGKMRNGRPMFAATTASN
jgi:hypothetical protein